MPKGVTISKLSREMSRALGLGFSFVETRARALQAAGLLPSGQSGHAEVNAATLDPEHALLVLLAILSGRTGERAAKDTQIYAGLRLLEVGQVKAGARSVGISAPFPAPAGGHAEGSETLLLSLRKLLVASWGEKPWEFTVRALSLGGGLGARTASVVLAPSANPSVSIGLRFGFAANPLGASPDDGPPCCIRDSRQVNGDILSRLASVFSDEAHRRHATALETSTGGWRATGPILATHTRGAA